MIRSCSKRVLLVAPEAFPDQLLAEYNNVKHISGAAAIFPALHELRPDVILFDYKHMGENMERVLRRLQTNIFYKNIKLYCYKQTKSAITDSTLKVLGGPPHYLPCRSAKTSKSSPALNAINNLVNASLLKFMTGVV
jgi:hypothetical protein